MDLNKRQIERHVGLHIEHTRTQVYALTNCSVAATHKPHYASPWDFCWDYFLLVLESKGEVVEYDNSRGLPVHGCVTQTLLFHSHYSIVL